MWGYDYQMLKSDLKNLGIPYFSVGESFAGRHIYAFKLGTGKKQVFYNGAHHGAEPLTARLLIRFAADCLSANHRLYGFSVAQLLKCVTLHIMPMVNPDGVEIAKTYDGVWQSNAQGVDINHNYDAGFWDYKILEKQQNITAGATRFSGEAPESEPETKAVCKYVRQHNFDMCIAFHSQGEVIYYDYNGFVPAGGEAICRALCDQTVYVPDFTEGLASYGGFKDWFIKKYLKPAFTVEVGLGKNPLPAYQFEEIYQKTVRLLLLAPFLC